MTSVRTIGTRFSPNTVGGGTKLEGRLLRSTRGADRGWPDVVGRVAFFAAGATGIALWTGFTGMLAVTLPVAVVAGLILLVFVPSRIRRDMDAKRLRTAHPDEPWRWDHRWDQRGARDDSTPAEAATSFAAALFMTVFGAGFTGAGLWFFITGDTRRRLFALPFIVFGLLFDYVVVRLFLDGSRLTARRVKYGPGAASFDRFPFRRGGRLRLHVQAPPALPRQALVTATLRCIQERHEITATTEDRSRFHCYEVYRDTGPVEQIDTVPGARTLRVTFSLPADAPLTELSAYPCRYWEVELQAATEGVDYAARFLVPVY
jgi:hypothetical protein